MDWYKHEPAAWLGGVAKLSAEQRGIYDTILNLIYLHDGPIECNWRWLAGNCNEHERLVKRVVGELMQAGKLGLDADGKLFNNRANVTLLHRRTLAVIRASAGHNGGRQSSITRKEKQTLSRSKNEANGEAKTKREDKKESKSLSSFGTKSEYEPSAELVQREHEYQKRHY